MKIVWFCCSLKYENIKRTWQMVGSLIGRCRYYCRLLPKGFDRKLSCCDKYETTQQSVDIKSYDLVLDIFSTYFVMHRYKLILYEYGYHITTHIYAVKDMCYVVQLPLMFREIALDPRCHSKRCFTNGENEIFHTWGATVFENSTFSGLLIIYYS